MKVLLIDPISSTNHITYNDLLIQSLLKIHNIEIYTFFGYEYNKYFNKYNIKRFSYLPKILYNEKYNLVSKYKICNIVLLLLRNFYIKYKIQNTSFNNYIFSSFEIFSIFPFLFQKNNHLYFICHNNYKDLDNKLKIFIYKILQKQSLIVVLSEYVKKYFYQKNIYNTIIHPHGMPSKFSLNFENEIHVLNKFKLKKNTYIFLTGEYTIDDIMILKKQISKNYKDLKIFCRQYQSSINDINNYDFISYEFLHREEYETLLFNSSFVVINYFNNKNYSTSNTFLECLINNIQVKTNNINLISYYFPKHNKYIYYSSLNNIFENKEYEKVEYVLNNNSDLINLLLHD